MEQDERTLKKFEEMHDELLQLKMDHGKAKSKIVLLEGMVSEMEEDNARLKEEHRLFHDKMELSDKQHISNIRQIQQELDAVTASKESLEERLRVLEREPVPVPSRSCVSPDEPEPADCGHECVMTQLEKEREEAMNTAEMFLLRNTKLEEEIRQLREEHENALAEARELSRSLRESKEIISELEGRIFEAQTTSKFAAKGNSMFSEFVDERVKLEEDLKSLFAESAMLRRENKALKNELDNTMLREEPAGTGGFCRCQALEQELYETRVALHKRDNEMRLHLGDAMGKLAEQATDSLIRAQLHTYREQLGGLMCEMGKLREGRQSAIDRAAIAEQQLNAITLRERSLNRKLERVLAERNAETDAASAPISIPECIARSTGDEPRSPSAPPPSAPSTFKRMDVTPPEIRVKRIRFEIDESNRSTIGESVERRERPPRKQPMKGRRVLSKIVIQQDTPFSLLSSKQPDDSVVLEHPSHDD